MRPLSSITQRIFRLTILLLLFACLSCSQEPVQNPGPQYGKKGDGQSNGTLKFGVLPNQTQTKLIKDYLPLVAYLNSELKVPQLSLYTSRDFPSYESAIKEGKLEFLLPNPYQALEAMKSGYRVLAMAGDTKDFRGIIVVRKNSRLRSVKDLQGKIISYPAPTALAACMMIQEYLHRQKVETTSHYAVSHESSLMNVYLRQAIAAGTSPRSWRTFVNDHPAESQELTILGETEHLVNNAVMARKDVPSDIQERIRTTLLKLHETDEGRAILKNIETDRFYAAVDSDYDVVRNFMERFNKDVRPVPAK